MKINGLSNSQNFGSLKVIVDRRLLNLPNMNKQVQQMRRLFRDNGFDKKQNVDVFLNYSPSRGFFAFIQDKKTGIVPFSYASEHKISFQPREIEDFKSWLNDIDYSHSEKGKKEWKRLNRMAVDYMSKAKSKK